MKHHQTLALVESLLPLLKANRIEAAAETWRQRQIDRGNCTDVCPYGDTVSSRRCALCLEGRMRALSLVAHVDDWELCALRNGANLIRDWLQQKSADEASGSMNLQEQPVENG